MSSRFAPRPSGPLPTSTDVLIVGYGPVGATLACLLGRYGIRTVVIDRADDILMMPRAIGIDNEGQRALQVAGITEPDFPKLAIPVCSLISPWFGEFARLETGGVLDGYPKLASFYQPDLERALRAEVSRHDAVTVSTGTSLLGFRETADGVVARVSSTERNREAEQVEQAEQEISARYLIGADGASSMIRRLIGQDFRGRSYAEDWLIVDAVNSKEPIDHIEFHCRPRGAAPHLPAPGGRERWEFMLQPGETPETMETDEEIRKLLAPWGDASTMQIERRAVYRFHARCVERFREGSVFLIGDAAHITPPFAGQGLMSGLRDAINLGWKLAWVLRGHASPGILDSYDEERRPHARAMIDLARLMGHLITPRNRAKAFVVHGMVKALRMISPLRRYLDGVKMKPRHRHARGLFVAGGDRGLRGSWLPQALVRGTDGRTCLSDDLFGDHLTLVGFGVDPGEHLDPELRSAWEAVGGNVVQIAMRGQALNRREGACEDLSGTMVPDCLPFGWAVVLRPDRMILHDGPATDASRLLRESMDCLAGAAGERTAGSQATNTDQG